MAAVAAAFAFETVAGMRHVAQHQVAAWMRAHEHYEERRLMQLVLIALVIALILVVSAARVSKTRPNDRALRCSAIGVLVVFASFLVETVSLHEVDAYLYTPAGPLLLIGWWWLAASLAITAASLRS